MTSQGNSPGARDEGRDGDALPEGSGPDSSTIRRRPSARWLSPRYSTVFVLALLAGLLAVPVAFHQTGLDGAGCMLLGEDGLYETVGALCCLAGGMLLLRSFAAALFVGRRGIEGVHFTPTWYTSRLLAALAILALFGEEISWGQRLFEVSTQPWQFEVTGPPEDWALHFVATLTDEVELRIMLLYPVAILFMGVLPLAGPESRLRRFLERYLALPLPRRAWGIAVLGSVVVSIAGTRWMTRQESSEIFELVFEASLLKLALTMYRQDCRESIGRASWQATGVMAGCFSLVAVALFHDMATDRYALLHGYEKLATRYLDEKNYPQAMHFLERAREVRPDYIPVLMKLAGVHQVSGDEKGSEQILREVLEIAPRQVNVLTHLGHLYLDRGDLASAEPLLERAYKERSRRVEILMGMGRLRFAQNRYLEAAKHFRAVLERDANHKEAGQYLERCLAHSSPSDSQKG